MSAAEVRKPSVMDILRRLAAFADVADNRHFADDDSVITEWMSKKGSTELRASLRVGDCRAAREFLKNVGSAKAKKEAEDAFSPPRKAAFGDTDDRLP